jgi:heat shock protein HspQ
MVAGDPRRGPAAQGSAFYHLFAENAETEYVACVLEQNLMADPSGDPLRHPQADEMFVRARDGADKIKTARLN